MLCYLPTTYYYHCYYDDDEYQYYCDLFYCYDDDGDDDFCNFLLPMTTTMIAVPAVQMLGECEKSVRHPSASISMQLTSYVLAP